MAKSSKPLPKRLQPRQKRAQTSRGDEEEGGTTEEETTSCIKTDSNGSNAFTSSGNGGLFDLSPIFRLLAGILFGAFISLSYQPLVNDPICLPFMGKDSAAPDHPNFHQESYHPMLQLQDLDKMPWWKGWLLSTICESSSKISGFLLRFGVSVSGAMLIALILNFIFAKWRNGESLFCKYYYVIM